MFGPIDKKSSFYEEDYGLCFLHFVFILSLEALLSIAEKVYSIKYIQFEIKILPEHSVCVTMYIFPAMFSNMILRVSKPSTEDAF